MRKICLALCLTLLTSFIHAAVMPIDGALSQSHEAVLAETSSHHCDDLSHDSHDSLSAKSCHGNSYQCCLGLPLVHAPDSKLSTLFVETLVAINSSLLIELIGNPIYKPPKII